MFDLKGYEASLLEGAWVTLEVALASLLLAINTIVCCTPLFVVAIFKLCLPFAAAQRCTDQGQIPVRHPRCRTGPRMA